MAELVLMGRAVQGDPYKLAPKKDNNNKTVLDAQGQPVMQYFLALAVQKGDPKLPAVRAAIEADAARYWPSGETRRQDFAWKFVDGDSTAVNKANRRICDIDGYRGCIVFKFGSLYAPKVQYWDALAPNDRGGTGKWVDSPGGHVKLGDYVSVAFETASNKSMQTPGLHLNPKLVGFESAGDPIVGASGPEGDDVFGARGGPTSGAPAASQSGTVATGQTSQTASPGDAPAAPYTGYMEDTPAPPAGPQMTAKAGATTYEAFRAKGWTDDQLRAQGYMA